MDTSSNQMRLTIYLSEHDRHEGQALHEWIVYESHRRGLAGATVLRGVMGYSGHGPVHSSKVVVISDDLPFLVQVIDTEPALRELAETIRGLHPRGMILLEPVHRL